MNNGHSTPGIPNPDHEKNILRMSQMYRTLSRSNRAIAHDSGREALFADICNIAIETGSFAQAWIGLLDQASNVISCAAAAGDTRIDPRPLLTPTAGFGQAIRADRSHVGHAIAEEEQRASLAMAAFPLRENHHIAGVLVLVAREAEFFTASLTALLEEMAQDISFALEKLSAQEKRAALAEALRESEERWSFALEGSSEGVWDWNTQTNRMFYSTGYWKILGFAPGEAHATVEDFDARIHPEDKPGVLENTVKLFSGEIPDLAREYRLRCKDGSYKWVLSRGKVMARTPEGQPARVIGTISDISARKAVEADQQLSALVFKHSREAIIITDSNNCIVSVNAAFSKITGYPPEEVLGRNPRIFSSGRHDKAFYQKLWNDLLDQGHWYGEIWNRRKNGDVYPEWLSITALRDAAGNIERHIAIFSDISSLKESQVSLQLAAQVFGLSSEAIVITDHDNHIVSVNRAFTEFTGYTLPEVLGCNPRMFASGRHDIGFYKAMWDGILHAGGWQGEIWNRHKNGNIFPEWLSITTIKDKDDQITHHIGMFSDITERKRTEERLHQLANYDALTGLPNRELFHTHIDQGIAKAQRHHAPLTLLALDLDHIKEINASFGHEAGDQLLKLVADRLRDIVPAHSTGTHHGGDVFHILLPGLDIDGAEHMAQTLLVQLSHPYLLDGNEVVVTPSIGISIYPTDGTDGDAMIHNAEAAMFRAKGGRSGYQFFAPEMNVKSLQRLTLESSLRRALQQQEFTLHYQPQVSLRDGSIVGAEALLRWNHPEMGMVSPPAFLDMAEESGVIVPLGEWTMRQVCHQIKTWQQAGVSMVPISVNISFRQFHQLRQLENIIRENAVDPALLEFELTEHALLHDVDETAQMISRLKQHGIRTTLDNFGIGYFSLAYLKRFRLEQLKIDQSFVHDLAENADDRAIVSAMVCLAHSLQLSVVAKGVETRQQLDFLQSLDCDQVQGYLFSEALAADRFLSLLQQGKVFDL